MRYSGAVRYWILVLLLSTGCGRFGFDAQPPADATGDAIAARIANGHDEDADGFGDGEDNCPHLANAE